VKAVAEKRRQDVHELTRWCVPYEFHEPHARPVTVMVFVSPSSASTNFTVWVPALSVGTPGPAWYRWKPRVVGNIEDAGAARMPQVWGNSPKLIAGVVAVVGSMGVAWGFAGCASIVGIPGHEISGASPDDASGASDAMKTVDAGSSEEEAASDASCFQDGDLSNACYTCEDTYCCPQQEACGADCHEYITCLKACVAADGPDSGVENTSCELQCDSTYSGGHEAGAPLVACITQSCFAPCGGGAGDPCAECLQANCGQVSYACQSTAACDTMWTCIMGCGLSNSACVSDCEAQGTMATAEAAESEASCGLLYCMGATECGGSGGGSSGSTTACGVAFGSLFPDNEQSQLASCAGCVMTSCCQQTQDCANSTTCAQLLNTLYGCAGDSNCESTALADANGTAAGESYNVAISCWTSTCASTCDVN
jgi:hypothetical protein